MFMPGIVKCWVVYVAGGPAVAVFIGQQASFTGRDDHTHLYISTMLRVDVQTSARQEYKTNVCANIVYYNHG